MTSEQEEVDAQVNRKKRSAVEKFMVWTIISSIIVSIVLLYLDKTRDIFTNEFLDIAGFYPERFLIGPMPEMVKIVLFVSNAFTFLYIIIHLAVMKPEIIRNDYNRQDRKILLWMLCSFFYALRFFMLWSLSSDSKSALIVIIPSLTIVSVSTALVSLSTVGGDLRT